MSRSERQLQVVVGRQLRETSDVAGAIRRLIRSLGSRAAHEDTDALHNLRDLEAELESAWKVAIAGLRRSGFSDTDIGTELGITKQAVQKRWPRPSKEDSR